MKEDGFEVVNSRDEYLKSDNLFNKYFWLMEEKDLDPSDLSRLRNSGRKGNTGRYCDGCSSSGGIVGSKETVLEFLEPDRKKNPELVSLLNEACEECFASGAPTPLVKNLLRVSMK